MDFTVQVLYFIFDNLRIRESGFVYDLGSVFHNLRMRWVTQHVELLLLNQKYSPVLVQVRNQKVNYVEARLRLKFSCQEKQTEPGNNRLGLRR
jgi:hypothetical protein